MNNSRSSTRQKIIRMRQDKWFKGLFGFSEEEYKWSAIQSCFQLRNDADGIPQLVSNVNKQSYGIGTFSTPSLGELRNKLSSLSESSSSGEKKQVLQLSHLAVDDVFELHAMEEYAGATFMAASQANCLEFASPRVTPEDGVTGYVYDRTQGPACALAAPAATVFRNYFCPMANGEVGQREDNQLNIFEDLLSHLHLKNSEELVVVQNGYTFSNNRKLQQLNKNIPTNNDPIRRDELLALLRVGVHSNVEVPWNGRRFELLSQSKDRQTVTQVYCSAISCGYSHGSSAAWEPLARLVLDASYEATLCTAAIELLDKQKQTGSGTVLLTFLGGGVFGNESEWIEGAIVRACVKLAHLPLKVILCHYRSVDMHVANRINDQIKFLRETSSSSSS